MMENQGILFGEIRKYCSRLDRVSICMQETLSYENYEWIQDVPKEYDNKYLYGFGVIDSEFDNTFKKCMEIMLSEKPRRDLC